MSQIRYRECDPHGDFCDSEVDIQFSIELNRGIEQHCIIEKRLLESVLAMMTHRDRLGEMSTQQALHQSSQALLAAASEAMRHGPSTDGPLRLEFRHFSLVDADQAPSL